MEIRDIEVGARVRHKDSVFMVGVVQELRTVNGRERVRVQWPASCASEWMRADYLRPA